MDNPLGITDFVALANPPKGWKPKAPATVSCVETGRKKTRRLLIGFAEEISAQMKAVRRFTVAWSPKHGTFRIAPTNDGKFEATVTVKGRRWLLRVPVPAGYPFELGARTLGWSVHAGVLYLTGPAAAPVKPAPAIAMRGDPEPGRSALDQRGRE